MPDSAWRGRSAFVVFAFFLVLVGAFFLWDAAVFLTEQRVRYEEAAQRNSHEADERIQYECSASLAFVDLVGCLRQEIESGEDRNRAKRDLDAQEVMARFTRLVGYTGLLGIFLGGVSVYLIWATLRETQGMAAITREIGQAQVRAYPSVTSVNIDCINNGLLELTIKVRNSGNSPALRMKCRGEITLSYQEEVPPQGTFAQRSMRHPIVSIVQVPIPPNLGGEISAYAPHGVGEEAAEVMKAMASVMPRKNHFWSVSVYFDWTDVFGDEYTFYIIAGQHPISREAFGATSAYSESILKTPFEISYQSESTKRD